MGYVKVSVAMLFAKRAAVAVMAGKRDMSLFRLEKEINALLPLKRTFHVDRSCSAPLYSVSKASQRKDVPRTVSGVHDQDFTLSPLPGSGSIAETSQTDTQTPLSGYCIPKEHIHIEQFSSRINSTTESEADFNSFLEIENEVIDIRRFMNGKLSSRSPGGTLPQKENSRQPNVAGEQHNPFVERISPGSTKNGLMITNSIGIINRLDHCPKHTLNVSDRSPSVHSPVDSAHPQHPPVDTGSHPPPTRTSTLRSASPAPSGNGVPHATLSTSTSRLPRPRMNHPLAMAREAEGSLSLEDKCSARVMDEWDDALRESAGSRTRPLPSATETETETETEKSVEGAVGEIEASTEGREEAASVGASTAVALTLPAVSVDVEVADEETENADVDEALDDEAVDDAFDDRFACATTMVDDACGSRELYVKSGFVQAMEETEAFADGIIPWFGVPTKEYCDTLCVEGSVGRTSRLFGGGVGRRASWGSKVRRTLKRNGDSFQGGRGNGGESEARRSSFGFGMLVSNSWRKRASECDNFSDY